MCCPTRLRRHVAPDEVRARAQVRGGDRGLTGMSVGLCLQGGRWLQSGTRRCDSVSLGHRELAFIRPTGLNREGGRRAYLEMAALGHGGNFSGNKAIRHILIQPQINCSEIFGANFLF